MYRTTSITVRFALLSVFLVLITMLAPLPAIGQTFVQLSSGPIYPAPALGSLIKGQTGVPLQYQIVNTSNGSIVIDSIKYVPACDSSSFTSCTGAAVENVFSNFSTGTTDASSGDCTGLTFTFSAPVAGVITITPSSTITLPQSTSCIFDFTADVTGVPNVDVDSGIAGFQTFGTGFSAAHGAVSGLNGSGTGSSEVGIDTCEIKLDKQISCDGGATWQDVSGFGATGEGSATDASNAATLGCIAKVGTNVQVRYVLSNALATAAPVSCTGFTDASTTGTATVTATFPIQPQAASSPVVINGTPFACANTNSGPDTATLSTCTCTGINGVVGTPVSVPVDSGSVLSDTATHLCADVTIDKQISCNSGATFTDQGQVRSNGDGTNSCTGPSTGNAFEAQWFAQNQGSVPLTCVLNDTNHSFLGSPITGISLATGLSTPTLIGGPSAAVSCSTITGQEPDTATLTCSPSAAIVATGIVDRTGGLSVFDSASATCITSRPSFTANKICTPTSAGSSTFTSTVTVFNTDASGGSTLSCSVVDTEHVGPCSSPGASIGPVTITPNPISVGASSSGCSMNGAGCTSAFGSGTLTVSGPVCNEATVTCTSGTTSLTPLTVTADCAAAAIKLKKVFPTDTVVSGTTGYSVTFTIINEGSVPLTGISFSDTLPTGFTTTFTGGALCGGTVTVTGGNIIQLTGGKLAVGGSCDIDVTPVTVPTVTAQTRACDETSAITTNQVTGEAAFACVTVNTTGAPNAPPLSPTDSFQVDYVSNVSPNHDAIINITNTGSHGLHPDGDICVNVYLFDPAEEMLACCSCLVTPNGLQSISVNNDLLVNRLTPGPAPTSVVIKLLANATDPGLCDPSFPDFQNLVPGLRAWDTTLHFKPGDTLASGPSATTENPFEQSRLSAGELKHLSTFCAFIEANGSGFGLCNSCRVGALGGAKASQ